MYTCYAMFLNHLYVLNLLQSMNLFSLHVCVGLPMFQVFHSDCLLYVHTPAQCVLCFEIFVTVEKETRHTLTHH